MYRKKSNLCGKYTFDNTWENASKMVIPRTGKYKITYTDDDNNYYGGQEILKKGDKLIQDKWGWHIQGKPKTYHNSYTADNGEDPESPDYEEYTCYLDTIEYIGEA